MLINKQCAAQMESCIKQSHIEVTRQYKEGQILEINGGAACFSGFESYLSQVVGWGFSSKAKQFRHEITAIEHFYQALGHPRVDIELCPFAGNDLACFLSDEGYRVSELNNVSFLDLKAYQKIDCSSDEWLIRPVRTDELDVWARHVALGFAYPEAEEQFSYYARATGVVAFGAFVHEQLVAGATLALHGAFCDLAVTSTLPAYRGRGLQKRLLATRLNFAKDQGLHVAMVTTDPGSISDLNIQKLGFRCAYTRIKMSLGE